jgi:hypothetical protein
MRPLVVAALLHLVAGQPATPKESLQADWDEMDQDEAHETMCPRGKYEDAQIASACKKCEVGRWQNGKGQDSCMACPSGTFQPVTGMYSCYDCPQGKYQTADASTSCLSCVDQCSKGRYSVPQAAGLTDPKKCTCAACPSGYYSEAKSTKCSACTPGLYQPKPHSFSCYACPVGRYSRRSAEKKCNPCSKGETSYAGSPSCTNREKIFVLEFKGVNYKLAPAIKDSDWKLLSLKNLQQYKSLFAQYYKDFGGLRLMADWSTNRCCITLEGGDRLVANEASFVYPYENGRLIECTSEAGQKPTKFYKDRVYGLGFTTSESRTSYKDILSSKSYDSLPGFGNCTAASDESNMGIFMKKTKVKTNTTRCLSIHDKLYCIAEKIHLQNTAAPTVAPSAAPTSAPTSAPTLAPTSPTAVPTSLPTEVPTPAPSALPTTSPTNVPTRETGYPTTFPTRAPSAVPTTAEPTSHPTVGPTPTPTTAPTVVPTSAPTEPADCRVGNWSGYSACTRSCNGGDKTRDRKVLVQPQLGGFICPPLTQSTPCNQLCCDGYHLAASTLSNQSCTLCLAGQYRRQSDQNSAACSPCKAGSFAERAGSSRCSDCPLKYFSRAHGTMCSACKPGKYSTLGTQKPSSGEVSKEHKSCTKYKSCPAGEFLTGRLVKGGSGNAQVLAGGRCVSCPSGKYKPEDGLWSSSCMVCEKCAVGEERTGCGNASAAGQVPYTSSSEGHCSKCPPGRAGYGNTRCNECGVGKYQAESGETQCKDCPPGKAQEQEGKGSSTHCTPCPGGKFADSTTHSCINCKQGMYAMHPGLARCESCVAGRFGASNSSAHTSETPCQECAVGMYQHGQGQASCLRCPAGYHAHQAGTSSCTRCLKGEYAHEAYGKALCSTCESGRFAVVTHNRTFRMRQVLPRGLCIKCPAGKHQAGVEEHAKHTRASACLGCETGKYQDATGRIECKDCPRGKHTAKQGEGSCSLCMPGKWQALAGERSCLKCSSGMYAVKFHRHGAATGATYCTLCPGESVTSSSICW